MSCKQRTLCSPIVFCGKGLHTGLNVNMVIRPAGACEGIVFKRIDLKGAPSVPALSDYVTDTKRGTTIQRGAAKVSTIEHIMSALWNMGVDNAVIEIDAAEVPIMDGSALAYSKEIAETGLRELDAERNIFKVTERSVFSVPQRGIEIAVEPAQDFSVDVNVDYDSKVIGRQNAHFDSETSFQNEVAPCRTFVFLHEISLLLKLGLIKGGDIGNAIVVVEKSISESEIKRLSKTFKQDIKIENGYLNNIPLRFPNEIARHKLLDVLGDLSLLGMRIEGHVEALRPGHWANTETVKGLRKLIVTQ